MDAKGTEIEWQFEAPDLEAVERWVEQASPVEGVTITPSDGDDHLDTYLDTGDGRLDHAGYSVRLRRRPGRPSVATLKSLGSAQPDSPLVRLELEEELEADEPAAVTRAPGPVGERVRDLIGSDELVRAFRRVDAQTSLPARAKGGSDRRAPARRDRGTRAGRADNRPPSPGRGRAAGACG